MIPTSTYSNLKQASRLLGNKNLFAFMRLVGNRTSFKHSKAILETEEKVHSINGISHGFCSKCQLIIEPVEVKRTNPAERTAVSKSDLSANEASDESVNSLSNISVRVTVDGISTQDELDDIEIAEELPKPLDICTEDLSHIHSRRNMSYNIAKYANESYVIRELIKLGVKVHKLDTDTALAEFYLTRNFNKDVKPYIQFLYDNGVAVDVLGEVLSDNLRLLKSDLDDLHNRIKYMQSHRFTNEMIAAMIVKCPQWLCQCIEIMDANLGYIQSAVKANGQEIRHIAALNPAILISTKLNLSIIMFSLTEEMGFSCKHVRGMLLSEPAILTTERLKLIDTFDYLHNTMNLSHEVIAREPKIIFFRKDRIQSRHEFLKTIGRAQYDPKKPLYVCPLTFVKVSDEEFCHSICKCSTEIYYQFVKLL